MQDSVLPIAQIRNVILDLGGVLYRIDTSLTHAALRALAGPGARQDKWTQPVFQALEKGLVEPAVFREMLRAHLDSKASDAELDAAWNVLLLGVIPGREELVKRLASKFRVILLSNTNAIHEKVWGPQCANLFAPMERLWYSYEMQMRKPDREIYDHVIQAMGMQPEESLFLDDSPENVQAAIDAGWHSQWVDPKDDFHLERICLKLLGKE